MKYLMRVCNEEHYNDYPTMIDVVAEDLELGEGYEPIDFLRDNVLDCIDIEEIDEGATYRVSYLEFGCEKAQYFNFVGV